MFFLNWHYLSNRRSKQIKSSVCCAGPLTWWMCTSSTSQEVVTAPSLVWITTFLKLCRTKYILMLRKKGVERGCLRKMQYFNTISIHFCSDTVLSLRTKICFYLGLCMYTRCYNLCSWCTVLKLHFRGFNGGKCALWSTMHRMSWILVSLLILIANLWPALNIRSKQLGNVCSHSRSWVYFPISSRSLYYVALVTVQYMCIFCGIGFHLHVQHHTDTYWYTSVYNLFPASR